MSNNKIYTGYIYKLQINNVVELKTYGKKGIYTVVDLYEWGQNIVLTLIDISLNKKMIISLPYDFKI